MATTWADCVALDASLAAVPLAAQTAILADCYATLDEDRWGDDLDMAVKSPAMHTGVLCLRSGLGGTGAVQSEHLGDASVSYAVSVAYAEHDLDATSWGKRFMFFSKRLGPVMLVT